MSPDELAAIRERHEAAMAETPRPTNEMWSRERVGEAYLQAILDRRALLAHIDALEATVGNHDENCDDHCTLRMELEALLRGCL
ncbi:MAG TPA: hypothetical protein VFX15_02770 [Actinomycetes bacterium]|nr:hypothetical protein [Actinomycetes bacterium]